VKITRPIAGLLLVLLIMLFALTTGLFGISYFVGDRDSTSERVQDSIDSARLGALVLAGVVLISSTLIRQDKSAQNSDLMKHYGGTLRALFSRDYWHERAALDTPYVPTWLFPACFIIALGILLFNLGLPADHNHTYGSLIRESTVLPFAYGIMALPVLYSNWRETSQPAASPSPEVRPS
jgi:hypothetical protein